MSEKHVIPMLNLKNFGRLLMKSSKKHIVIMIC